jgi:7-carboxy-7-deazaguanine synthase
MRIAEIFRSIQGEGRLTGTESIFVRTSGCNLRCGYCDTPYASWTPEGEELPVDEILARVGELQQLPPPAFASQASPLPLAGAPSEISPLPLAGEGQGVRAEGAVPSAASPHPSPLPKGEGRHVVLTGGEPMLWAELVPLTTRLRDRGWHITIETSGTLYLPVVCDLMSVSPKLSNSTPEGDPRWSERQTLNRQAPDVIHRLAAEYDCQWKFVIDRPEDCDEVEDFLAEFPAIEQSRVLLMPQGTDAGVLAEKAAWLGPYCVRRGYQFCPRRQIEWFGAERGK